MDRQKAGRHIIIYRQATGRQEGRQADRQAGRQQAGRQKDRQAGKCVCVSVCVCVCERERERERERDCLSVCLSVRKRAPAYFTIDRRPCFVG